MYFTKKMIKLRSLPLHLSIISVSGIFITSCNSGSINDPANPNLSSKYVFVSKSSPNGKMEVSGLKIPSELNPIQKADYICNYDAKDTNWIAKSKGAESMTWKAMIVDGKYRQAAPNSIDWVFKPSQMYKDAVSGNNIGTTTAKSIFETTLTATYGYNNTSGSMSTYDPKKYFYKEYIDDVTPNNIFTIWTGLDKNFMTATNKCANWTTTNESESGTVGATSLLISDPETGGWDYVNAEGWGPYGGSRAISCKNQDGAVQVNKYTGTTVYVTVRLLCVQQ